MAMRTVSLIIFLFISVCFSQLREKIEKYYFLSILLDDQELATNEVFSFPEYRVPQVVTYHKDSKDLMAEYNFDAQGRFLDSRQTHDLRFNGSIYIEECTYREGKLTGILYGLGMKEEIKYDSVSNRSSSCLYYSSGNLMYRTEYLYKQDTLIITTTDSDVISIQVITKDSIDTLKITKVNIRAKDTLVSSSVYKNGFYQGGTINKSGNLFRWGTLLGNRTTRITDVFVFDSTGKKVKRVLTETTVFFEDFIVKSKDSSVITHVYTNDSSGRPLKIQPYYYSKKFIQPYYGSKKLIEEKTNTIEKNRTTFIDIEYGDLISNKVTDKSGSPDTNWVDVPPTNNVTKE